MKRLRVLNFVGSMNRGGIETWLMQVLRSLPEDEIQLDFVVNTRTPGEYEDELLRRGARVYRIKNYRNLLGYRRQLGEIFMGAGQCDIVHVHLQDFSGIVVTAASRLGVRQRIVHSHNDTRLARRHSDGIRRFYYWMMRRLILEKSTSNIACSEGAAESLFGPKWSVDPRNLVLHYGIETSVFRSLDTKSAIRADLGIPEGVTVIGHVGRFERQKNHKFLIEAFWEYQKLVPNSFLLLVGGGSLVDLVRAEVCARGIASKVRFLGVRGDVPRILKAMDLFLLPSLHEGLPMVLIEAQAAGIPYVIADNITKEADVVEGLGCRVSLGLPASGWAIEMRGHTSREFGDRCKMKSLRCVEDSDFNIAVSSARLLSHYKAITGTQ